MAKIAIFGGGLAGLAATVALAQRGHQVALYESKNRLGGRASSFLDSETQQLIDNCQHVSMGCCTNFSHFCRTVGIGSYLEPQKNLFFMTPDGRVSRFGADSLPAPFHLARSFAGAHFLSLDDKWRIGFGLLQLKKYGHPDDPPFMDWLINNKQTENTIRRFWSVVLVSALNETPDRIGLRYARKVFVDGFLSHRRGFEVELPAVPLGKFYGNEVLQWLSDHQVEFHFQQGIKALEIEGDQVQTGRLRNGESVQADSYISALPFQRLLEVLPEDAIEEHSYFQRLKQLEISPITSVHVWLDRSITHLPHIVFVDCEGQWLFKRDSTSPGEHYYQVVVSAARQFRGLGHEEVQRRIVEELRKLFPKAISAKVLRARVITEHAATFSAVPNVDQIRPGQSSPVKNLFIAGDWTATGWPATMEGAVRGGYLAAEKVLERLGETVSLVQPDL